MTQDVSGVVAKLERAGALLGELDQMAFAYLADHPFTFDVTLDRALRQYTVVVHVKETPASLAVVFGEVLHDLRSALDHTARLLVLADGKKPVDHGPRKTAFPILEKRPERQVDIAPGVSSPIRDVLGLVQPFMAAEPQKDMLWRLNHLNNVDKHRLLHVTGLSGNGGAAFVPAPLDPSRATTQEQRRHVVRLVPDVPQVFEVNEDEMFEPATVAGLWGYTVGLGGPDSNWGNQLVGVGRGMLVHLAQDVLPRFGPFLD
ncbi:hypothetical protein [Mesorhizobium japonicum]|uniref:hypothetical protein n=1 Tax=Mesorhizobium japonicum TaxID=2066070 RepID=UPI003B5B2512